VTGIGFAAPWVLAVASAALLPIIAHLARQEDRAGTGFPSLMFLSRVPFPSRARRRVQDRPLLALRLLALLSLVLAFAGPYPVYEEGAGPRPDRDTVVLLDESYSMGAEGRFQQARAEAAAVIAATAGGERVALVAFDESARVLSALAEDGAAAQRALVRVRPGYRGTDMAAALDTAARLLAAGGARARRVVLVSDLQAVGLGADPRLPHDVELEVRPVAGTAFGNLSLAAASLERDASSADGRVMLRARVINTGGRALTSRLVVSVDGLEAGERRLSLAPGASEEAALPVFPSPERATRIALALDDDGLAADNQRFLIAAPRRSLSVLMVGHADVTPYLDAALALARDPEIVVQRVTPTRLTGAALDDVDVVVLDAPVTGVAVTELVTRVSAGLGVLALATALEDTGSAGILLPRRIGAVLEAPAAGDSLLAASSSHPLAAVLGGGEVAIGPVWRRVQVAPAEDDVVLARFDDGSPALLERSAGRVLLLATSPSPAWSGIALRPEFAPFVVQAVTHLAGVTPAADAHAPGSVLDPASLTRSMALTAADAAAFAAALERGEDLTLRVPSGALVRLGPTASVMLDEPGFHELRAGASRPVSLAVSVEAGESRLDALPVEQFLTRVARLPGLGSGPRSSADGVSGVGDESARDESLARVLLMVGLALLLAEGLLAALTARRRASVQAPA